MTRVWDVDTYLCEDRYAVTQRLEELKKENQHDSYIVDYNECKIYARTDVLDNDVRVVHQKEDAQYPTVWKEVTGKAKTIDIQRIEYDNRVALQEAIAKYDQELKYGDLFVDYGSMAIEIHTPVPHPEYARIIPVDPNRRTLRHIARSNTMCDIKTDEEMVVQQREEFLRALVTMRREIIDQPITDQPVIEQIINRVDQTYASIFDLLDGKDNDHLYAIVPVRQTAASELQEALQVHAMQRMEAAVFAAEDGMGEVDSDIRPLDIGGNLCMDFFDMVND